MKIKHHLQCIPRYFIGILAQEIPNTSQIIFPKEKPEKRKQVTQAGRARNKRKRNKSRRVARAVKTATLRSTHAALPLCRSLLFGKVRWRPAITWLPFYRLKVENTEAVPFGTNRQAVKARNRDLKNENAEKMQQGNCIFQFPVPEEAKAPLQRWHMEGKVNVFWLLD